MRTALMILAVLVATLTLPVVAGAVYQVIETEMGGLHPKDEPDTFYSRIEGIGPFHCEAGLTDLRGVRRCNAGELCPNVANDVEVAVRAVVISQTQIGTDRLRV